MCVNKPIIITWRDKQFEDFLFRMNSIMTQNKTRLVLKLFGVLVLKMAAFVRFVDNRGRYSTLPVINFIFVAGGGGIQWRSLGPCYIDQENKKHKPEYLMFMNIYLYQW